MDLIDIMRRTHTWVRLTGIAMFVSAVLALFAVIDSVTGGSYLSVKEPSAEELLMSASLGVANVVFEVILGYALIVYASRISAFLVTTQPDEMEKALNANRQFWKAAGIYAIVMIAAFVAMMIFMAMVTYNAIQATAH